MATLWRRRERGLGYRCRCHARASRGRLRCGAGGREPERGRNCQECYPLPSSHL